MMRDSRGRFVNKHVGSATLLLEVALTEALEQIVKGHVKVIGSGSMRRFGRVRHEATPAVVQMLAEATRSADLLLKGGE